MVNEYKLAFLKHEIFVVITLGIVLAIVSTLFTRNISVINNFEHLPSAYQAGLIYGMNMLRILYVIMIPIIAALSYADSFFQEKRSGVYVYRLVRESKKRYFFTKAVVIFSLAFILTTFPLVLNQGFCLLAFDHEQHTNAQMNTPYDDSFFMEEEISITYPRFAANEPLAANLVYIALTGLYGSALALATYGLTLFYRRNRASVLLAPLIVAFALELVSSFTIADISPVNALSVKSYIPVNSVIPIIILIFTIIAISISALLIRVRVKYDET